MFSIDTVIQCKIQKKNLVYLYNTIGIYVPDSLQIQKFISNCAGFYKPKKKRNFLFYFVGKNKLSLNCFNLSLHVALVKTSAKFSLL